MLEQIIDTFVQINQIPRCSKQEERISSWLQQWAADRDFPTKRDTTGNLLITVPASPGCEAAPVVVLQGHMDMVCEKAPDSTHDFATDPIRVLEDGDWLTADGTTLGSDNGIALALAMVIATAPDVKRPPLELLFTVDEETGLTGALKMADDLVGGRILINIDSEDEGLFTIGCAGGVETRLSLPIQLAEAGNTAGFWQITAGGMRGGHSGIDIHKHRANAIKVMARALSTVDDHGELRLHTLAGGRSHNAIPREVAAVFAAPPDTDVAGIVAGFESVVKREYARREPGLFVTATPAEIETGAPVWSRESTRTALALLLALPDGVDAMSADFEGLVETSSNLARVALEGDTLHITSSQRSSVASRLEEITLQVVSTARLAGATRDHRNAYPSWEPDPASPLLKRCRDVYHRLFQKEPEVKAIHAGLECGVIGARYDGMEMISLGPTIRNPHSPDERLHVPSVGRVWDFLVALLGSYTEAI